MSRQLMRILGWAVLVTGLLTVPGVRIVMGPGASSIALSLGLVVALAGGLLGVVGSGPVSTENRKFVWLLPSSMLSTVNLLGSPSPNWVDTCW